ncbi:MAG: anaerobic ribonucleoside-triphosphate reductase activating protein [Lachnospiraceae bacterium]
MRYHNITTDDMKNGDGLRVVLWVSGCRHHCEGCQNRVTWNPEDGLLFDADAKEEIFHELEKSYISGLTLSGGDPLFPDNISEITELAKEVKERFPDKTIWLYTGDTWEDVKSLPVMQYVDIVIDGMFKKELLNTQLPWRGSSNQRIIDVKKNSILE